MTLAIRKLTVALAVGPRGSGLGAEVDDVFRRRVPAELGAQLGPALDREAAVVRIRQMQLRMTVSTADIDSGRLTSLWVRCFCQALFAVLAHPDGTTSAGLVRFSSRARYLAAQAVTLLHLPDPNMQWIRDAALLKFRTPADLARQIAAEEPQHLPQMLREMEAMGWLQAFLLTLDELVLEELMQAVERLSVHPSGAESLASLVQCALAMAQATIEHRRPQQWKLDSRRSAIWLWSTLPETSGSLGPQQVWLVLQALALLLLDPSQIGTGVITGVPETAGRATLAKHLAELTRVAESDQARQQLLHSLRIIAPAMMMEAPLESHWIVSNVAGMLLFLDQIRRLRWHERLPPYAFPVIIAAVAAELTGPKYRRDPAIFLLAGSLEVFEDRRSTEFFRDHAPAAEPLGAEGATWTKILASAAESLAHELAKRIRGFRQASSLAVQRNIALRAGRYRVEPHRIVVVLESGPWDVALHISGIDDAVDHVAWLGGRRVEFVLEGM